MDTFVSAIVVSFIFFTLYFEVFLLVSLFEHKKRSRVLKKGTYEPKVSILIPCWNEEETIGKTLDSLLALRYPKENYSIIVVNDGSTDGTLKALEPYQNNPQIKIFTKENGGKHTALNFGLEKVETEFVGCLDADSFVDPEALSNIMARFEEGSVMAVTPSTVVATPKTLIQRMQKAEYHYGNFIRQAMASINSIHIAPGPFSFFRMDVFRKLGPYHKAHNTEDMEIAMRMQKNGMKIAHASNALIHTTSPENIQKLYKQRVRWVSGFFGNIIDYRSMLLNSKYGDLGILVLPVALASIFLTIPFALATFYRMLSSIWVNLEGLYFGGLQSLSLPSFDLFSINTGVVSLLSLFMLLSVIIILASSRKMTSGKWKFSIDFLYLLIYTFIAPFWLLKAIYNNIFSKQSSWR